MKFKAKGLYKESYKNTDVKNISEESKFMKDSEIKKFMNEIAEQLKEHGDFIVEPYSGHNVLDVWLKGKKKKGFVEIEFTNHSHVEVGSEKTDARYCIAIDSSGHDLDSEIYHVAITDEWHGIDGLAGIVMSSFNNEIKENKLQERHDRGLDEAYPELDKKIKDMVEAATEKIGDAFEMLVRGEVEQIEHKSRDGFISSNDGGYQSNSFSDVGMLVGMGLGDLPSKAQDAIQKQYEYGLEMALETFKKDYADEIKDIPEDKLNYHDLYDMDKGDLAEKLSNLESEMNGDEQSTVMFQIRVMFHNNGPENLSFTVQGAINWEAPYHRPKGQWEDYYEADVDFTEEEIDSVIPKVQAEVDAALKHMGV